MATRIVAPGGAFTHPQVVGSLRNRWTAYEIRPRFYDQALRRDLVFAADQLERSIEANNNAQADLLLNMAADWLAQTITDLAVAVISEEHTSEFFHNLGDVLALVAGADALMGSENASPSGQTDATSVLRGGRKALPPCQGGAEPPPPLRTAAVLIERAHDGVRALLPD